MDKPMKSFRRGREGIGILFGAMAVMLLILPFWTSFQDLLTRIIMSIGWYKSLQEFVVPYELRIISLLMNSVGFHVQANSTSIQWLDRTGVKQTIYIIWNCVGWQSFVMLIITFIAGLSRRYTYSSRFEAFMIGLTGTYLVNILRLVLVVWVYFLTGRLFGTIFHDYFSGLITFAWLFVYWWFSYKYVLEEKHRFGKKAAETAQAEA